MSSQLTGLAALSNISMIILLAMPADNGGESTEDRTKVKTRQYCSEIKGVTLNTKPYGLCQKNGRIVFKFPNKKVEQ